MFYNVPTKMSGQILSDSSDDVHVDKRPCRNAAPMTKLLDKNNLERPGLLPFQQKSINDYWAAREAQDATTASDNENPTVSHATLPTSQILDMTSSPPPTDCANDKRQISEVNISSDSDSAPASRAEPTDRPPKEKDT